MVEKNQRLLMLMCCCSY